MSEIEDNRPDEETELESFIRGCTDKWTYYNTESHIWHDADRPQAEDGE